MFIKEKLVHTITYSFPQGKLKIVTFSYDDGHLADKRLINIFNTYQLKGTFCLNSGLIEQGERIPSREIKEMYQGHEVAAHTMTHPVISRCPGPQLIQQIMEDRKNLEESVGYPVRGLSYPFNSYNQDIINLLPYLGIEYARTAENSDSFTMPDNLYAWKPTCHHNQNLLKLADDFLALKNRQSTNIFFVWGHSHEFKTNQDWSLIEEFCKRISNQSDTWYASNIEIVDYLSVINNLKFSADSSFVFNPSAASAWIEVDDDIIEVKTGSQVKLF